MTDAPEPYGLTRTEAVALVQRVMDQDYTGDREVDGWLARLDRALRCPTGYVSGLIFWPESGEPTAEQVVDQALAYRPIAL